MVKQLKHISRLFAQCGCCSFIYILRRGQFRPQTFRTVHSSLWERGVFSLQMESIPALTVHSFGEMTHSLNTFLVELQVPAWAHQPFPHINEHSRGSIPCQEDRSPWLGKGGCSCAEKTNKFQWTLLRATA